MTKTKLVVLAVLALAGVPARAADHADSPSVKTAVDPSADITDVYAWMSGDKTQVYLIMNVLPQAGAGARFSPQVQYVFHVSSLQAYGQAPTGTTNIICTFSADTTQLASCWLGATDYANGDASASGGLASARGHFKVFAGLRDDPFFFNLAGLKFMQKYMHDNLDNRGLKLNTFEDLSGCPHLQPIAATSFEAGLRSDGNGGPGVDAFAGKNVLSIVLAVDVAQLNKTTNTVLGVWASTHKAQ